MKEFFEIAKIFFGMLLGGGGGGENNTYGQPTLFADDDGKPAFPRFQEPAWHNGFGAMPDWTMTAESGGTKMAGSLDSDFDAHEINAFSSWEPAGMHSSEKMFDCQ